MLGVKYITLSGQCSNILLPETRQTCHPDLYTHAPQGWCGQDNIYSRCFLTPATRFHCGRGLTCVQDPTGSSSHRCGEPWRHHCSLWAFRHPPRTGRRCDVLQPHLTEPRMFCWPARRHQWHYTSVKYFKVLLPWGANIGHPLFAINSSIHPLLDFIIN